LDKLRARIVQPPMELPLGDGRYVVAEKVTLGEGVMTLNCRTRRR